jgi:lipoprotein-anchoring transpeptidase ErfK/SrfK
VKKPVLSRLRQPGRGHSARATAGVILTGLVLVLAACSSGGKTVTSGAPVAGGTSSGATTAASSASSSASTAAAKPVHVSLNLGDGGQVGVGMPIIATFKTKITSGVAFQQATKVTVNGAAVPAAWYFEYSDPASGHVMEGHLRTQNYWPGHAHIHVDLPVKGLSAGKGLAFDDSLTLDFSTGSQNISTVDDVAHTLTLRVDGALEGTYPISLGASNTPTLSGTKVIMEKGVSICMSGPGYDECGIKYTQRLTYGGEYLHSAPWNVYNITHGVDSSNGCTNLLPNDAQKLYGLLEIGDVVIYPNANGGKMQLGQGYGDWNVPWSQWQTGGAVSTTT